MTKTAVEKAQERQQEELDRLEGKTEEMAEESQPEHKELVDVLPKPDTIENPEWLEDAGRCRARVLFEDCEVTLSDPGAKYFDAWGLYQNLDKPDLEQQFSYMLSRSVTKSIIPALRSVEELGVKEGSNLPPPTQFAKTHRDEWRKWRKQCENIVQKNRERRLALATEEEKKTFIPDEIPEFPETKLSQLIMEEWPQTLLFRCFLGIAYAVFGNDSRWKMVLRQHNKVMDVDELMKSIKEADIEGN
jgi:hypothetical protein